MITLTAEVLCDSCGKVCGVGEPHNAITSQPQWATSAIESAEARARSHGAQINVASVTCAECLKEKDETAEGICKDARSFWNGQYYEKDAT